MAVAEIFLKKTESILNPIFLPFNYDLRVERNGPYVFVEYSSKSLRRQFRFIYDFLRGTTPKYQILFEVEKLGGMFTKPRYVDYLKNIDAIESHEMTISDVLELLENLIRSEMMEVVTGEIDLSRVK